MTNFLAIYPSYKLTLTDMHLGKQPTVVAVLMRNELPGDFGYLAKLVCRNKPRIYSGY